MRGPRVRVGGVSSPLAGVCVAASAGGDATGGAISRTGVSNSLGCSRGGRPRLRVTSPRTWWQNKATEVLHVGKQWRVSSSAMERYEARFCRNSIMTSFAADNSWNFCGRSGVNSSTALRILAGLNADMILQCVECNQNVRCRGRGHLSATYKPRSNREHGLYADADKSRFCPFGGLAVPVATACSRTVH